MPKFIVSTDWKWQTSNLPIRKLPSKAEKAIGEIKYQIISSDIETDPLHEKLKIWTDKQFPFEQGVGFIWHKSWNLPEIKIVIDDLENQHLRSQYQQIGCEVLAVYPIKNGKFYYLQQVGLTGSSEKYFEENHLSLKYIKFSATSFSHNRNKFCLLLVIYGETKEGEKYDLFSMISSPIYVDSRKQARKKPDKNRNSLSVSCPKKFFTQICNKKNSQFNTPEGFLSYYGAPNIRNKIKHFFYLGYHFDKVFSIYRNQNFKQMIDELLEAIKVPNKGGQNLFLILINTTNEREKKKIVGMIEKWKFWCIAFEFPEGTISNKWKIISKDQIRESYKTYYERESLKEQQDYSQEQQQSESEEKQQQPGQNNGMETFELRTVIDLNKGRKRVKLQQQYQQI